MASPRLVGLALIAVVFVGLVAAYVEQDPNHCSQWTTCKECISHNLCGWCGVPVVYEDGSRGPYCAGKSLDPNNPPPGFKPWVCPKDYQNQRCYGYVCNQDNFQCESAGQSGKGVELAECLQQCFPPTYECDTDEWVCKQVEPGHGTDLPSCERQCIAPTPEPEPSPNPEPNPNPNPNPSPNPNPNPNPSPSHELYVCDKKTLECVLTDSDGGTPLEDCLSTCGKSTNSTPAELIGDYRGLQVSAGYVEGEWVASITAEAAIILDPKGDVWGKGQIHTLSEELWLVTSQGARRGLRSYQILPEVGVLTWALGDFNGPVPDTIDDAMTSGTVLVLAKCLRADVCEFESVFRAVARSFNLKHTSKVSVKRVIPDGAQGKDAMVALRRASVNDPCSQFPDCQSCISAPYYCGWCSVNILYNSTIEGRNCAGVNVSITNYRINCTGQFSITDCFQPPQPNPNPNPNPGPAPQPVLYACNPQTQTCEEVESSADGGMSLRDCEIQCVSNPGVPPALKEKIYRGLQINEGYQKGEWRAEFGNSSVTVVAPTGTIIEGAVSVTAQYLSLKFEFGTVHSLWQIAGGPVTEFLSWAWGIPGGEAPKNFDEAMVTDLMSEYFFTACQPPKPDTPPNCDFSRK